MEQDKTSFDINKYAKPLLRRKWLWIIPTIIIGAVTVIYALNKPDIYETRCVLLVERSKVLSSVLSERNVQLDVRQVLQAVSERMLAWQPVTQVIRDVGIGKELTEDDEGDLEKLYLKVKKNIKLNTRGKNFIVISYRGENPEINFGIVNGLVSYFMEESLKSSRSEVEETLEFIEKDLERLKGDLDRSEREFRKFEEEHIEELPSSDGSVLPEFYAARSELAEFDMKIIALNEKLKYLNSRKGEENETIAGEVVKIPNPKLKDLEKQITSLEINITILRAKYYDKHPRIMQMQSELSQLNKLLEEESEKVVTEETIINNPRYESMIAKEFDMRLELKSLQSQRKEIESAIVRFKPTIEKIPLLKQKLFELQADYNMNRKLYEDRLLQKSKAVLVREMSLDAKSNPFNVIEPARISYAPVKGVKLKTLAVGFFLGAGLGIALVFGLEQIDPRFKTIEEIQEYLQIPALGAIPTIITKTDIKRKIRKRIIMAGIVALFVIIAITVCLVVQPVKDTLNANVTKVIKLVK